MFMVIRRIKRIFDKRLFLNKSFLFITKLFMNKNYDADNWIFKA